MANRSLDDPRRQVKLGTERVYDVSNTEFPHNYPGEPDLAWDINRFRQGLKVQVQRLSHRSVEFDLIGVDASIANAFRRILIAEVPTVAIESVYVWNNTSVVHDEVFAQRLGLVPLDVDPALMSFPALDGNSTDRDTLVFRLNVKCERRKGVAKGETDPEKLYENSNVLSGHLVWVPNGEQAEIFGRPVKPTNENILLAKLRPGQEVTMEMHAIKGRGSEHAKWSPVGTASYRLLPHIKIDKSIPPELCDKFASCFSPGVIAVERNANGEKTVRVADARPDTMSREVLRHPEFEGMVSLSRIRDFFLCKFLHFLKIETESAYAPERLFEESVKVFRQKVSAVKKAAMALEAEFHPHMVEERKIPPEARNRDTSSAQKRQHRSKRGGGARSAAAAVVDDPMDES
ncbi:DNA-directed RNA polymerase [Auriculariales sp. MPI-PUGE-AT-0066]|nr:DNA-directed RNA polymerase [Auriculariales sp. MPI-PUGE-AT-0066]